MVVSEIVSRNQTLMHGALASLVPSLVLPRGYRSGYEAKYSAGQRHRKLECRQLSARIPGASFFDSHDAMSREGSEGESSLAEPER